MNVGKALGFVFEDPQWLVKLLIGSVILLLSFLFTPVLIGVVGFFIVAGYSLEVLRNVRLGVPQPLPEWKDRWGEWLVLGLKLLAALFIWSLPATLLNLPVWMLSAILGEGNEIVGLFATLVSCLAFLWTLVVLLVTPAIYVRMAETEELVSAFQFNDIFEFTRDHIGDVIIAIVVAVVVGVFAFFMGAVVGTLLCIVGLAITLPAATLYTSLVSAHLYGQIGRRPASGPSEPGPPVTVQPTQPSVTPEPPATEARTSPSSEVQASTDLEHGDELPQ